MKILNTLFFVALFFVSQAQVTFTDQSSLLERQNFRSGVSVGIADMNGDGLDDIIRLNGGTELQVDYQTPGCLTYMQSSVTYSVLSNPVWNIAIADVNNDGWNDFMVGGTFEDIQLFLADPFAQTFTQSTFPNSSFFAQGANFVDIDEDGFLDAFICDDDAENKIYMNDKNGAFSFVDLIDFNTVPPSDNSGNYGSLWTDFDMDGDLDLYIAKCRAGVEDVTDPRRINALYINIGNNEFIEAADSFNIADNGQSWTADFADLDRDGDFDCFITQHDRICTVYENRGDTTFVDVTDASGVFVSGATIQGSLIDFDNDGLQDILISGAQHALYLNDGGMKFTEVDDPFGDNQMESFAIGDLNDDGFMDIYASYADVINSPSNDNDLLWMNDGNDNNWIRLALRGSESNANGVGAMVELYNTDGVQYREVRAGEGYGISFTHTVHFGIGEAESIDSVMVKWPSGQIDVIHTPEVNRLSFVHEGRNVSTRLAMSENCAVLCSGDTAVLRAPENYTNYVWSNGETGPEITTADKGVYYVSFETMTGEKFQSESVNLRDTDLTSDRDLVVDGNIANCSSEAVTLTAPEAPGYMWSNGEVGQQITVNQSGFYLVELVGSCESVMSNPVTLTFYETDEPVVTNDTIQTAGSGTLTSSSEQTRWYINITDDVAAGTGAVFNTPIVDSTRDFYASQFQIIEAETQSVGEVQHQGVSLYGGNQFNGALIFDVLEPMRLDSVTVYTEFAGRRVIDVFDRFFQLIYQSDTLDIPEGESQIHIGLQLEPDTEYRIRTNDDVNELEFGFVNPRLYRSDREVDYPYTIDGLVEIKNSSFGEDFYYHFYDWKVRGMDLVCASERVVATVVVESTVSNEKLGKEFPGKVYPNPVSGELTIELPSSLETTIDRIRFVDVQGMEVLNTIPGRQQSYQVDVSSFPAGLYFVQLETNESQYFARIVVE